jgi:CHAT domain-containing protein
MFIGEFGVRLLLNSVPISLLFDKRNGYIIWNFDLALMCSHVLRVGSRAGGHTKYLTPNLRATKSIIKISMYI